MRRELSSFALGALAAVLLATGGASETVRDEFNAISFAGNDGTRNWSNAWQELGESNGPTGNRVRVVSSGRCASGNCLRIGGNDVDIDGRGALREADLSGASSATLTFTRRLRKFSNDAGSIALGVSDDGGSSWTTLQTFNLNGAASQVFESFDVSAYISANTQIRFLGSGDEVEAYFFADDVQIEFLGFGPHFEIAHDGAADTCNPEPVTISRHDASHGVDTSYAGTIDLSTSTGNGSWSLIAGAGTLTNGGGGTATYSFAPADAGRVTLGLANPTSETLNIDVTDGAASESPSEDPDLAFSSSSAETFRDEFGAVSYANDDGTLLWSGPWSEVDGAGAGPGAGNAQIQGGELSLEDYPNTDLDTSVEREADLSAFTSASFSFDFRTTSGVDSSDAVFIEVSSDGGSNWTILERITGISGASSASRSYDISAYISTQTRVRFRIDGLNGTGGTACCYGASGEQFLVQEVEIAASAPCVADHFAIGHDGSGSACVVEAITITRHDASHATDAGYAGTIAISTSTASGDWSLIAGAGTFAIAGGGDATYAFDPADAGQVVLGFRSGLPQTLNIDVTDGAFAELSAEDPDLVIAGATTTFRDDFNATSFSNDDGTASWAGAWIEVDGDGAGPGTGNVLIAGGSLSLDDRPNTGGQPSLEREADLSSAVAATLSFDFATTSGVDTSDAVVIEISDDGGASWTILETFTGLSGATSGSRSYDVSAYRAANTRVRLRVTNFYGGGNENFLVDYLQIEAPTPAICGPDHFAIDHDGSGVHCQAENVTITAHDASEGVDAGYVDTIALSTSTGHGDWSVVAGAGALANAGNGNATYAFAAADAGQVVLGLRNTFSETLNIDVDDGTVFESPAEDPDLVFASAGFNFLADGVASAIGTQIGGKPSNLAPGAQSLELQAIRTSDETGACEAALQGVQGIELAFSCMDPTTCAGPQLNANGVGVAANDFGTPLSYSVVDFDFGDASDPTAPLLIAYPDVGRIQLHARYTLSPSGESLLGSSNLFAVRPFGFHVTAPGNLAATDPSGPIFTRAGADFAANVRAVLWQAADDGDGDGDGDGHADLDAANNADLSDNGTAPNYGREAAVESVALGANLIEPAGGTDPGLGGATAIASFAAGSGSTPNVYYDEVGLAELSSAVGDGDYLGIGALETAKILGRSGFVGRFIPDHFDVGVDTPPRFATACDAGGFTYVGEPFVWDQAPVLRVTARSARNTQTANYTGPWWKIANATLTNRNYASDPGAPAGLDPSGLPDPTGDPTWVDLGDGSGTLSFDLGSGLRFSRAGPIPPFDAEIALSIDVADADGVVYPTNPFQIGDPSPGNGIAWSAGASQRYGRVAIDNAFGSELVALPVPLRAEYWTGSGFALHGDDGCTSLRSLAPANIGTTARSPVGLATDPSVANDPLLSGDAGLSFSPPGAEGWADVLVNLSALDVNTPWGTITGADLPWLQWDWTTDGAGLPDDDPSARITFGIFGGQAPVIFRREIY